MERDLKTITILGLGYVGLPLAVEFSKHHRVIGFDIDLDRVNQLKDGMDVTNEVSSEALEGALVRGVETKNLGLKFTNSLDDSTNSDVFIVTVPTPITKSKIPDLMPLKIASEAIGSVMKRGSLVIYESTTYPGCTEEVCIPILEAFSGLTLNFDFYAGYSPERVVPGDKNKTLVDIPKVTSGSNDVATEMVDNLYSQILRVKTHKAPSIKVAEASKLVENCQRDLNISFVNELAYIFDRIGISTYDVLEAAATKWNFIKLTPGLVGGHCISVDPYYMLHKAQELKYHPEVITSGRRVNENMPAFISSKIIKELIKRGKNPTDCHCLVLGLTFKENCPDTRNTKVLELISELQDFGLPVKGYDPIAQFSQTPDVEIADSLSGFDIIVLAVPHDEFLALDFDLILKDQNSFIFDLKRAVGHHKRSVTI